MTERCLIDDCVRPALARGWCSAHYQRWRKHGDPLGQSRRTRATCSVEGCGKPAEAHRLCVKHVTRLRRTGTTQPRATALERFNELVAMAGPNDCWEWMGPRNNANYGRVGLQYAHRVACERAHGAPPGPDMVAMHACDNPPCVNPAHLSWGYQSENVKDSWARTRRKANA